MKARTSSTAWVERLTLTLRIERDVRDTSLMATPPWSRGGEPHSVSNRSRNSPASPAGGAAGLMTMSESIASASADSSGERTSRTDARPVSQSAWNCPTLPVRLSRATQGVPVTRAKIMPWSRSVTTSRAARKSAHALSSSASASARLSRASPTWVSRRRTSSRAPAKRSTSERTAPEVSISASSRSASRTPSRPAAGCERSRVRTTSGARPLRVPGKDSSKNARVRLSRASRTTSGWDASTLRARASASRPYVDALKSADWGTRSPGLPGTTRRPGRAGAGCRRRGRRCCRRRRG